MTFSTILKLWGYFHSFYVPHLNGEGSMKGKFCCQFFTNARSCMTFWKVLEKTYHPNKSWVLKTGSYFQRDNFPDLLEQAVLWLRRAPFGSSGSLWTSICTLQPAAPVSSVTDSPSQASYRSHPGKHKDSKALLTLKPLLSGKHLGAARYLFCDAPSPGDNGITPKLRPKTLLLLIQQMLSLEQDCTGCCSHNYLNTRMSWKDYITRQHLILPS